MTGLLLKVLNSDGTAYHGGTGRWALPKGDKPGAWKLVRGSLIPCERGLHLCRPEHLINWLGPAIFVAEHDGELIEHGTDTISTKVVARKARLIRRLDNWNERTMRLFAIECAERVLPIYEREQPNDDRPRRALEVARRFANGEATRDELDAARAATWDAAGAATWDAARAAAWDAASAAAWDATLDAARAAAWDAARAAAWDATRAAAKAATWDAAGAAARAAARAAERQWQTTRVINILELDV